MIALVTAERARERDEDMPLLIGALSSAGAPAQAVVWDDPTVDWASFALAVVRSTWDYAGRRDDFLTWAERVARATTLLNPPEVLRWNTDKRYLEDFQSGGIPIVPTRWLAPGDPIEIPFEGELVVKPSIGAGAMDAARHAAPTTAREHVARLHAKGRVAMIQPYVRDLDERGETALIYIADRYSEAKAGGTSACAGGIRYSHAIRKAPILTDDRKIVGGLHAEERIRATRPSQEQRDLADRVIASAPSPLLYARVDLAPGDAGPLLLEFEASEPSLFLAYGDGAAERFARAIQETL